MLKTTIARIVLLATAIPPLTVHGASWLPMAATDHDYLANGNPPQAQVELGQALFFDKILSGNLNISCATCHHPLAGTGDGLSLGIGEGGRGVGIARDSGSNGSAVHERVPRNAPPLFNIGAHEYSRHFHDGRVEADPQDPDAFLTPAGGELPAGLNSVLAAQAMFPVTSMTEMAGQAGENNQANAANEGRLAGYEGVWGIIARKLQSIPQYGEMFKAAFPEEIAVSSDIRFQHAANAIAAFESVAWRADNSPFDRYLRGNNGALSAQQRAGMKVFYGAGGCAECHSGTFQTDHEFHAIAMPQIGPGKGHNLDGYADGLDDFGREGVTGNPDDRYRFRTPSLRNIALTAPFGHSGAFDTLEQVVRHHQDAVQSLHSFDAAQATLPDNQDFAATDFEFMGDTVRVDALAAANELPPGHLSESEIQALIAFLHALTDPGALDMRNTVPGSVPSGLPIWD